MFWCSPVFSYGALRGAPYWLHAEKKQNRAPIGHMPVSELDFTIFPCLSSVGESSLFCEPGRAYREPIRNTVGVLTLGHPNKVIWGSEGNKTCFFVSDVGFSPISGLLDMQKETVPSHISQFHLLTCWKVDTFEPMRNMPAIHSYKRVSVAGFKVSQPCASVSQLSAAPRRLQEKQEHAAGIWEYISC